MKNHIRPLLLIIAILLAGCVNQTHIIHPKQITLDKIKAVDGAWIIQSAEKYLNIAPVTVTAAQCDRSQGGLHDFYSEGDYWWPNPDDPEGPYIRKDGQSNPDNFLDHRLAMRKMSIAVASLTAAFKLTGDAKYATPAVRNLKAWFIDPATKMTANMNYAQAIKGRVPGRGVGLIDGIHFVEPVQAIMILHHSGQITDDDYLLFQAWFSEFLAWMMTHEYGIDERDRTNNHGTCWVMQASIYAKLTENQEMLDYCSYRFKTVILPNQMSEDGSFHLELNRTKPYGYSLFNMDIMATVCHILSTPENNLWTYQLENGSGPAKAMEFIVPFIDDKSAWTYTPDVMYWDQWPARHPALLFAGTALNRSDYIHLWEQFPPLPKTQEGLRNFPIRQPILWYD
ncbi:MAG: alginate lyase family protein [Candidatus Marinimicrobia bacterium]|nr:alginate lyase family protein [Candidatus Neomarinimicrobiota bacterium]